jgi:hypothetical protein
MTWKNLILVSFLAVLPVLVGCGADCESLCEDDNEECEGEKQNCSDTCSDIEELNDKAGCEDSWDELVECIDDADDICADNICGSESTAWGSCIAKYCTAHVGAAECNVDF